MRISDWSSDVCSSDLGANPGARLEGRRTYLQLPVRSMIRPALPADLARIEAIVEAAYGPYPARMNRKPTPIVHDYTKRIAAGQNQVLEVNGVNISVLEMQPGARTTLLVTNHDQVAQTGER